VHSDQLTTATISPAVDDLKATDVSITPSPFYSRPFAHEAATLLSLPLHHIDLPCKPAARRAWVENLMTRDWRTSTRVKARHRLLKPSPDPPLYLSADTNLFLSFAHLFRLANTSTTPLSRPTALAATCLELWSTCPQPCLCSFLACCFADWSRYPANCECYLGRCTTRACQSFRQDTPQRAH